MLETIITAAAMKCLALNVYYEARNQSPAAMIAVTHVVLNRSQDEGYPSKVCDVVKQKDETKNVCQFSWVCNVKSYLTIKDKEAWDRSQKYAKMAYHLWKDGGDITDGAQFYHANYVKPKWAKTMKKTTIIDDHTFYKMKNNDTTY